MLCRLAVFGCCLWSWCAVVATACLAAPLLEPPSPVPSVVCNFQTGIATGVGAGAPCVSMLPTCNGIADDTAAFQSFARWAIRNWQASHNGVIELLIPSGLNCTLTTATVPFNGIRDLLVSGYGATLSSYNSYYHLGAAIMYQDNRHSTRLMAANKGDATIQVNPGSATQPAACNSNATCTALFTVGQYALITGFDLQTGVGFPPNPFYYEYVMPTTINPTTGIITLAAPLKHSYETTWPNYGTGGRAQPDYGGPATLYALPASWAATFEYDGLTFTVNAAAGSNGEWDAAGKNVTFKDVTMTYNGLGCFFPTVSLNVSIINSTMTNCTMEVDKIVDSLTITNTTINQIGFQSSSPVNFTLNGGSLVNLVGTPLNATINSATITGELIPGPTNYGRADSLIVNNSSVAAIGNQVNAAFGGYVFSGGNNEGFNNIEGLTMIAGMITIPNLYITSHADVLGWVTPGGNVCWSDLTYACASFFQIKDITKDAKNTYISTSLSGGLPSWSGQHMLRVRTHPAPQVTFNNVVGGADAIMLSNAPAGAPLYSYVSRTYNNASSAESQVPYFALWGAIASMKANVTVAYKGNLSATDRPGDLSHNYLNMSFGVTNYTATINLKRSGLRSLTVNGYPSSWVGTQSGDILPNDTQSLWAPTSWRDTLTDLSNDPTHPFSLSISATTKQNILLPYLLRRDIGGAIDDDSPAFINAAA